MKILDRYIVSSYVIKLVWAIIMATTVFLVLDLVQMSGKFFDQQVSLMVVSRYYFYFIPYIVYLILPVAALLATLFTVGGMTVSNELTAIRGSGVPFSRILVLLLVIASLSAVGSFFLGEEIVPVASRTRMDIDRYEIKKMPVESRARQGRLYFQLQEGRHLYIDHYLPSTREANGIELIQYDDGRVIHRTDAEKLVWLDGEWWVKGVVDRQFADNGDVTFTRDTIFTISGKGLSPDEFEKVQTKPEEMNWKELKEFIERLQRIGGDTVKWEVDLLSKISLPAASVIIVLFGAPIAAVRRRSGPALGFGMSLFVCFIYFGFIEVGRVLGYKGALSPWLSAWIGNLFFGVLGLLILARTSK